MEINTNQIENRIYVIRGAQVMLDSDLAEMFQVQTKVLNQTVKRNIERFPEIFYFQLYDTEWQPLRSQIVTLDVQKGKHRKYLPYVFTEQGVAMLSAVLKSEVAIKVSIQIIQAFVAMRKTLGQFHGVIQRLEGLEIKQMQADSKLEQVLKALESDVPLKQGIFFEGQLFDVAPRHALALHQINTTNNTLLYT